MTGGDKDLDPASELVEEDDEQTLPDSEEQALAPEQGSGPFAAGRAALLRHARLAPSAPGVYRMLDAAGEVL
jgi:excinuclease ABC subunit C